MRPFTLGVLIGVLLFDIGFGAALAHADQRRDWVIGFRKPGTYANLDLVFPGIQLGLERRISIYGRANELVVRVNSLMPLRFHEGSIDVDLRLLVLTLGGSVGVHDDFRLLAFGPGEPSDRQTRSDRQTAGRYRHDRWGYVEGRLTLTLPFNDHLVLQNVNTLRHDNRPDRSFDWRNGIMHDGRFLRSEVQLFMKHRDVGGFAPMLQVVVFTLSGVQHTQMNYGFALVTRPGIMPRNDIIFLQILYHFGGVLSPYDNRAGYGGIALLGPLTFIAAYRAVIDIGG